MEKTKAILQQIQRVRKIKQRNIHDCAAFLNISKEDYLDLEQGSRKITLPEIELLALFFGVSPLIFFQTDHLENQKLGILEEHVQSKYTQLRQKMILARIIAEMHKKSISPEQIQEQTDISLAELKAYDNGKKSIPIEHLLKISEVLGLTEEELIETSYATKTDNNGQHSRNQWQREFLSTDIQQDPNDDSSYYNQLMLALHELPKRDQAEVASFLLKKLQSNKFG